MLIATQSVDMVSPQLIAGLCLLRISTCCSFAVRTFVL